MVTTGIYCRDGCPARPDPTNVVGFDLAAAAEAAGFRPCLRCRPYRSSEPAGWVGPSELVCRAVRLVAGGALDGASEDDLGRRLGVSGRHLRRLFVTHLGTTPDAVARSRRAHFARRLLDETELPVTDIAFASGFGSVRQMHRTMRETFRAAPRELRAKRRRADRLVADGGLDLRLPFRGPLDWARTAAFLRARAIPGVEAVDEAGYRRTIEVGGHPGVIEVRPGETAGDGGHLLLRAHLPHWDGLIHVAGRVRRLFDLDADLDAATAVLARDPLLRERLDGHGALRVPGAWDPFEVAVRVVLGQQVSVAAASTLAGRVAERHGVPVPGLAPMALRRLFPDAPTLAVADLSGLGVTAARARAVRELAVAVADGRVVLDGSVELPRVVAALEELPGIGPWTAHAVAMRSCGERDAFPASDLGLRRAAGNGLPVSARELAARAEAWRPWRAYAAFLLWSG